MGPPEQAESLSGFACLINPVRWFWIRLDGPLLVRAPRSFWISPSESRTITGHLSQFNRITHLFIDAHQYSRRKSLPYEKLVLYTIVTGTLTVGRVEKK